MIFKIIIKEQNHKAISDLIKHKMKINSALSQIQSMLKKIWEELSESIQQIQDVIEMERASSLNIIYNNINLEEATFTDLETLVQIVKAKSINDWISQENSYLPKLERAKNWWEQEIRAFKKQSMEKIKKISPLIKQEQIQSRIQPIQEKDNLYELFTSLKDIDMEILSMIIDVFQKEKISDSIEFLSKAEDQNHKEQYFLQVENNLQLFQKQNKLKSYQCFSNNSTNMILIKRIIKLKHIQKLEKKSQIQFQQKIGQSIIFISYLPIIYGQQVRTIWIKFSQFISRNEGRFNETMFLNIKIHNTSLIGANFVKCNLSGSELENVDISGINLSGTQLLSCKWKNIRIQELHYLNGNGGAISSVCFSPDCTTLVSGNDDGSISLWDFKTGQPKSKLIGHSRQIYSINISSDGSTLASGSADKCIRLWDVKARKKNLNQLAIVVESYLYASLLMDQHQHLTGQNKTLLIDQNGKVVSVCFSPDDTTLVSGSKDMSMQEWMGILKVYILYASHLMVHFQHQVVEMSLSVYGILKQDNQNLHQLIMKVVCFSPDGAILASGFANNCIFLWNVKTGIQKFKLVGHYGNVTSVCFSPLGTILASGSMDNSIRLWDIQTGQQIYPLNNSNSDTKDKFYASLQNPPQSVEVNQIITILLISNNLYFKHKELKYLKENCEIIQAQTQRNYLDKEEVQFWKKIQNFHNIEIKIEYQSWIIYIIMNSNFNFYFLLRKWKLLKAISKILFIICNKLFRFFISQVQTSYSESRVYLIDTEFIFYISIQL
ncbi:unnamed protein product [Paramecium octaurelia]|uniref:Uncharacterized protein n=1 Tax=Paramecium octaurelia TaxID=43137 RepID=A0A8S1YMH4_PAROT|nr:unnamed protein product [Paramecium octaurelia]